MFHVLKATVTEAPIIHNLVHQIYYPTYKDILSRDQIDFMLEKSYSIKALEDSILANQDFYLLKRGNESLGFMALQKVDERIIRIEKLYFLPEYQGQGCGSFMIEYAEKVAKNNGRDILELNVNRGNKAYYFYLKQGFKVTQVVDIPYYGYVLDDYVMQKNF